MERTELVGYLDEYLSIRYIADYPGAMNGLQVEGAPEVRSIMTAVDASVASVAAAAAAGAGMLLVHHGLFWAGPGPVTGRTKRRLAPLIIDDISLYSAHLPLDAHPEVGNNVVLAHMLGLEVDAKFGEFKDELIGVSAVTDMELAGLAERVGAALGSEPRVLAFGPDTVRSVAIVSGGGGKAIKEAAAKGIDTLVTGELSHSEFFDAEEHGVNVVFAGHYATETVGVRALGEHISERFGLEHTFFDHPTGL